MSQFYDQQPEERFLDSAITDLTSGGVEKSQECIYSFFLKIIKTYSSEQILNQFECLFIKYEETDDPEPYNALGEIIFYKKQNEFKNTLVRCCYILNNNWAITGNIKACHQLADLFLCESIHAPTRIYKLKKLREWLNTFTYSEEYANLRALLSRTKTHQDQQNWSERFSSYLLVSECIDPSKPLEQRQYMQVLAKRMKKQFKFSLAMYTAKISSQVNANSQQLNPTNLGDNALLLIKRVLNKQGEESFKSIANKLNRQIQTVTFGEFKPIFFNYLGLSLDDFDVPTNKSLKVIQKFQNFQEHQNKHIMTLSLLYVTCNRTLKYLLIDEHHHPSDILQSSLESNNLLNPIIMLLKTVLLCSKSRLYLEIYVADLVKFYSKYSEEECRSFINFLDILNVTLAIFDEDTDYSLVKVKKDMDNEEDLVDEDLNNYRIFSQTRYNNLQK